MKNTNPTYTFRSLLEGDKPQEFDTFKDAFTCMFNWVNNQINKGGMTYRVLETVIWIETTGGASLFFYDARDLAVEQGILKDGKLVE